MLVVAVEWKSKNGSRLFGQCTRYLTQLKPGDKVIVDIKPSVMRLPDSHETPVVMAGLGTGMAPFRAFWQERAHVVWTQREVVGDMSLFFGSRSRFARVSIRR